MSEHNPLQIVFQAFTKVSNSVQTHLSNLIAQPQSPSPKTPSISISSSKVGPSQIDSTQLEPQHLIIKVTKEGCKRIELRRFSKTFFFLGFIQTLSSSGFVRKMSILSRMYPCKECADHFQEILRSNPVQVGSHAEFSQWLCHVHNTVNRSLDKVVFPCERVDARWGKLECEQRACDVLGSTSFWK